MTFQYQLNPDFFFFLRSKALAAKLEKSAIVFSQDHSKVFCCSCQAIKPFFLCAFLDTAVLSAQANYFQKILFHRKKICFKQESFTFLYSDNETKEEDGFTCVVHIK